MLRNESNVMINMLSYYNRTFLLVVFLGLTMLTTSNLWGVIETSEARYAEISREMYQSGDWLHPTLLNIRHYHKPPVTYWLTATAFSIFGVNSFAVRFFLVAAFCVQVLLIFRITLLLFESEKQSWLASLIYATLPVVLISTRGLTTDAYLTTFVLLSLYFWIQYRKIGSVTSLYIFSFTLGLAFLTKGPPALVVPGFVILSLRNYLPASGKTFHHHIFAFLIFSGVGFSWFACIISDNSSLLDYFIFRQVMDRLTNAEVFARSAPWYYYLAIFPLISLPWFISFVKYFLQRTNNSLAHKTLSIRISLGWILLPLILFSVSSSKLVLYIVPLFGGFSLVTAYCLIQEKSKGLIYFFSGFNSIIYTGLIVAPFIISDFDVEWWLLLLPITAMIVSLYYSSGRQTTEVTLAFLAITFAFVLIVYSAFFFRFNNLQANGTKPIATFIQNNNLLNRNVVVYDELLPSLAFELDKQIISVYDGNRSLKREAQFEKNDLWKMTQIDATDQQELNRLKALLAGSSVFIVKTKKIPGMKVGITSKWRFNNFGRWTLFYN